MTNHKTARIIIIFHNIKQPCLTKNQKCGICHIRRLDLGISGDQPSCGWNNSWLNNYPHQLINISKISLLYCIHQQRNICHPSLDIKPRVIPTRSLVQNIHHPNPVILLQNQNNPSYPTTSTPAKSESLPAAAPKQIFMPQCHLLLLVSN